MASTTLQKVTPLSADATFPYEKVVLASEVDGGETVLLTIPRRIFEQWVESHRTPTESVELNDVPITFDQTVEIEGL